MPPRPCPPPEPDDCRCACGSLLARWVQGGVELKCRRCKRVVRVELPAEGGPAGSRPLSVISVGGAG